MSDRVHPGTDQLDAYVRGSLDPADRGAIDGHLGECSQCRQTVNAKLDLGLAKTLPATGLETTVPLPASDPADLPVGTQVGRYVILGLLGRGAMGVVYAAFDPKLDRKVALKLLRSDVSWSDGAAMHERLLREARALAQLRHPNVVAVHDAGEHGGSVFIAMEYVEGDTVTQWLGGSPRTLREILRVFREAGQGLAAAHRAGLVHRDFKPDNVLVGKDGVVRVGDFGLARNAGPDEGVAVAGVSAAPVEASAELAGTPVYMGPELFSGRVATAQSDQFAFCASLWEALHGERPFAGNSIPELYSARSRGELRPPSARRVPRRVRLALVRGLAPEPSARFKDMDELITQLGRPRPRVRGALIAVALIVGVAAGAIATARWLQDRREAQCEPSRAVASLITPEQRAAIEQRFKQSHVAYATHTWLTAGRELDEWVQGWLTRQQAACLAAAREGSSPAPAVHGQLACLERQASNFRALRDELAKADEGAIRSVVDLVEVLPRDCRTLGELSIPADPKSRELFRTLDAQVQQATFLYEEARYDAARDAVLEAATAAHDAGFLALEADALLLAGRCELQLGRGAAARANFESSLRLAESSSEDSVVALDRLELFELASTVEADLPRAESLLKDVRSAIDRLGAPPDFEGEYQSSLAHLLLQKGDDAAAIAALEQALTLYGKSKGKRSLGYANQIYDLALTYNRLGRSREAAVRLDDALALYRDLLGPDHPYVAKAINLEAGIRTNEGKIDEAISLLEQTLHIYELNHLDQTGDYAAVTYNLGLLYGRRKSFDEEERRIRRAIAINEASHSSPLERADFFSGLAETLQNAGDLPRALEAANQAVTLKEQVLGKDSPRLGMTLATRAGILTSLKRAPDAVTDLQRALTLMNETNSSPVGREVTRFELARALYEVPGSKKKARALAQQVRDFLASQGPAFAEDVAEAETWLREHP